MIYVFEKERVPLIFGFFPAIAQKNQEYEFGMNSYDLNKIKSSVWEKVFNFYF